MDSGLSIKDSLLNLISQNFDQTNVIIKTYTNPEAYEIEIKDFKNNHEIKSYLPHDVTLSLYPKIVSLHIDEYTWEFKDNYQKAYKELENYLIALSEGRLVKKGLKFINEHLEIEEQ